MDSDKVWCTCWQWPSCNRLYRDGEGWGMGEWTKHWAFLANIYRFKWWLHWLLRLPRILWFKQMPQELWEAISNNVSAVRSHHGKSLEVKRFCSDITNLTGTMYPVHGCNQVATLSYCLKKSVVIQLRYLLPQDRLEVCAHMCQRLIHHP